ncbi:MAG TPA: hypothetical protein VFR87_11095 [Nocardioidaceae bacterium]|nr:hypothetical protein [Nocardioidaceae bacterium]
MERHRCTKCRNPIRSVAVARQGGGEDAWYHADCWAEVCTSEQEKYERQVQNVGLTALLAPYISGAPAGAPAGVSAGGPQEQLLPDVEQRQA